MLKIIHSESQNTAVQVIRNSGCHVREGAKECAVIKPLLDEYVIAMAEELMDRDIFCILILGNIFIECIIQT